MAPEIGRAAFGWAIFIILIAAGLLAVLTPGTPEFAITVFTLIIGVFFLGLVTILVRLAGRI
jgi:hypothetical protein